MTIAKINSVGADQSDRKAFLATVLIGLTAILMVVVQLASYIDGTGKFADTIFWVELIAGIVVVMGVSMGSPVLLREISERRQTEADALGARQQIEQLFQMTDMLQSAAGYVDANAVLHATASQLLSGFGGALYIFNNSQDRLDLSTSWDWLADTRLPDSVSPVHCWALKRGKYHLNLVGDGSLRCEHQSAETMVLEIPMMARGEVYGLFCIQATGADAALNLSEAAPLAGAIADAMSLALSNLALREKLRTQALRDPLTGLYNRRYMEDVLERFANLSERNGNSVSAIMLDLDHFKRLNDEQGHAMGDAVLREVAGALVGAIRPCDVACRYGGEEFFVLLPDCGLADAAAKAEVLRARIESLSENHGIRITASFGVAAIPESSDRSADLITSADAELYRAKREGRNRVASASPRRTRALDPALSIAAE